MPARRKQRESSRSRRPSAKRRPDADSGRAPKFRIVTATRRDAATILSLVRGLAQYEGLLREVRATLPRLREHGFGRQRRFQVLLCRSGRITIGFALYYLTYSTFLAGPKLFLEDLFVVPEWRGRGAGLALLAALARTAAQGGCAQMEWLVLRNNAPAIGFYRRLGARLQDQWIPVRLTGAPLRRVARR